MRDFIFDDMEDVYLRCSRNPNTHDFSEVPGVCIGVVKVMQVTSKAMMAVVDGVEHWFPFSQIHETSPIRPFMSEVGDTGLLVISKWLAKQKELKEVKEEDKLQALVDGAHMLARTFYEMQGFIANEGFRLDKALHTREKMCWHMACKAYELLLKTDIDEVIKELEEE
jgi:hypothetical protein